MIFASLRRSRALARAKRAFSLGRLDEAEASLTSALRTNGNDAVAHNLLGMVLRERGRAADAEAHFRQAIGLKPESADAYINLGAVLNEQRRAAEAEDAFRRALALEPKHAVAWCNLGLIVSDQGLQEQAEDCFLAALSAEPDYFYARLTLVMNKLLEVYGSADEIARARAAYELALRELPRWLPKAEDKIAAAADTVGWVTPFFLAYQGENDRELQRTYGKFICDLMAKRHPELASPPRMPVLEPGQPVRVGVVTAFFNNHSVWKTPVRGWIENIDCSRFEIHGYYTGHQEDRATVAARRACKQFVEGLLFDALAKKIRSDSLHVLIFPEIGMDPLTTKLATLRLAPVQCNSWGHPITSGMPTMDYYLSSDLMEPADGQEHYTEELVRLPNLSVHYTPVVHPVRPLGREEAGLRASAVVFFCAQSLFKYLPQYDVLFPRIAARLDDCQFVFFASQRAAQMTEKFQRRIARAFEQAGLDPSRHLVMLPRMDGASFQAVARVSDIFLDSIGWSGCNTTLEALVAGLPAVTMAGGSLRARHTYAFLKMMGLDELLASDFDSYVELAVRLARDATWRHALRERMLERLPRLAGDMACVRALETFLERAVNHRAQRA